ncbi:hypothetical protein D9M68_730160 [compost metagenome]
MHFVQDGQRLDELHQATAIIECHQVAGGHHVAAIVIAGYGHCSRGILVAEGHLGGIVADVLGHFDVHREHIHRCRGLRLLGLQVVAQGVADFFDQAARDRAIEAEHDALAIVDLAH